MIATYLLSLLLALTTSPDSTNMDGLSIGTQAPTFYSKLSGGGDFYLSRIVGQRSRPNLKSHIVLSFFTTSCVACRAEIPILHDLQEDFPTIKFYLVNIAEKDERCKAYIKKMGYTLPVLLDKYGKTAEKYKATHTPTLVIIDEDGKIVFFKKGFSKDKDDAKVIRNRLEKLVNRADQSLLDPNETTD